MILRLLILLILSCPLMASESNDPTLWTYDMTGTLAVDCSNARQVKHTWDEAHCVAALQGIVNRHQPRLYVFFVGGSKAEVDRFWFDLLRKPGAWLANRPVRNLPDLPGLIATFRDKIHGVVLYDEQVAATSNVASTIAGVEDLLPIRYDADPSSLCYLLTMDPKGPQLPVKLRLLNKDGSSMFTGKGIIPGSKTKSTGSAKCDAYLWAKERYLDTGRCDPTCLGYYIDAYWLKKPGGEIPNHTLSNHDYVIAKRGFIFDLGPWDDESPIDDPNQPTGTDARTLQTLMRAAYDQVKGNRMIHVSGFLPWDRKYTDQCGGKHGAVEGEWRYAETISCFNSYMDADALSLSGMANASLFRLFPLEKRYTQQRPTVENLKKRGLIGADGKPVARKFISFYVGDYDSAAWFYRHMPTYWNDPARGKIPLGWAFNPNLADRAAPIMDWVRRTASPNDHFISGDSGAGYITPGYLQEPRIYSGLPSGLAVWAEHCRRHYQRWDITVTGFIIDGNAPEMDTATKNAYASFSPDGFVAQKVPEQGLWKTTPFLRMNADIYRPVEQACDVVLNNLPDDKPGFRIFRTILWKPTDHQHLFELIQKRNPDVTIVDPHTLFLLLKLHYASGAK